MGNTKESDFSDGTIMSLENEKEGDVKFMEIFPAFILAIACFFSVLWMIFAVREPMDRMVIVFPPNSSSSENLMTIISAGGLIIDERIGGMVLEVQPADPSFLANIQGSRAWAVLSGGPSGGCSGPVALPRKNT